MGNKSEDDLIARVNYAHNHHCNVTDFPIGLIYVCYNDLYEKGNFTKQTEQFRLKCKAICMKRRQSDETGTLKNNRSTRRRI